MTAPVQVSLVCAWYNRADYIRDTLDSLLAQEFDDFEIILVNDGSPDPRVRDILDSYSDPRLRVIHQANTGFTLAIRRAIEASTAPFLAIQGAGDISLPQRLRRQYEALRADPALALAGCRYRIENMVTGQGAQVVPHCPQQGDLRFRGLSHGELMYRREVYDKVGGYRPIFMVGQGADLWMRLLRTHGAVIVPEELYVQRHFSDGVALAPDKLAARKIMNGVRVENELWFRRTGLDHIETYGPAAFSILGRRGFARRELVQVRIGQHRGAPGRAMARADPGPEIEALLRGLWPALRLRLSRLIRGRGPQA